MNVETPRRIQRDDAISFPHRCRADKANSLFKARGRDEGLSLCQKKDILGFVTIESHLLGLDVDGLSYSAEDRIRLTASDYVIASFMTRPED